MNDGTKEISVAVLTAFDKYSTTLSMAFLQMVVCDNLAVMPEEVHTTNLEVKKYIRENVGTLFGSELVQPVPNYDHCERRVWRLPIAHTVTYV